MCISITFTCTSPPIVGIVDCTHHRILFAGVLFLFSSAIVMRDICVSFVLSLPTIAGVVVLSHWRHVILLLNQHSPCTSFRICWLYSPCVIRSQSVGDCLQLSGSLGLWQEHWSLDAHRTSPHPLPIVLGCVWSPLPIPYMALWLEQVIRWMLLRLCFAFLAVLHTNHNNYSIGNAYKHPHLLKEGPDCPLSTSVPTCIVSVQHERHCNNREPFCLPFVWLDDFVSTRSIPVGTPYNQII